MLKHSCGNHLCLLVSGTFQDPLFLLFTINNYRPIIMLIQTIQADHYAGSIRIQLQKEKKKTGTYFQLKCRSLYRIFTVKKFYVESVLPVLKVGVKPGQLVTVHQVLGVAKVW